MEVNKKDSEFVNDQTKDLRPTRQDMERAVAHICENLTLVWESSGYEGNDSYEDRFLLVSEVPDKGSPQSIVSISEVINETDAMEILDKHAYASWDKVE